MPFVAFGAHARAYCSLPARTLLNVRRWLITFMVQVNPLIYPIMPVAEVAVE